MGWLIGWIGNGLENNMYTFKVKHEEMLYEFHSTQKTNQLVRKDMDAIELERLFSYTHIHTNMHMYVLYVIFT